MATPTSSLSAVGPGLKTWSSWLYSIRFPAILLGVVSIFLILFIYYQSTAVSGTELNVRTWEIRSFSFRRDPFTNFQISGVTHSAPKQFSAWIAAPTKLTAEIEPAIRKHLKNSTANSDRWDLVKFDSVATSDGKAKILVDLLLATDPNYNEHWKNWSTTNPAKAAVFWPAAQDLAYYELYSALPQLFEASLIESSNNEFKMQVSSIMLRSLTRRCQQMLNENDRSALKDIALAGLSYGDSAELQEIVSSNK